jgi:hypothetical protein
MRPAILLCLLLSAAIAQQQIYGDWLHKPGAISPTGSAERGFDNAHGLLLSTTGQRCVSGSNFVAVSIYHALVFHPDARLTGGSDGGGWNSDEALFWSVPKSTGDSEPERKRLDIVYNAIDKTVNIASNVFSLASGNLFIIRVDEFWVPRTIQLNAHLDDQKDAQTVLDYFKSEMPTDAAIQALKLTPIHIHSK